MCTHCTACILLSKQKEQPPVCVSTTCICVCVHAFTLSRVGQKRFPSQLKKKEKKTTPAMYRRQSGFWVVMVTLSRFSHAMANERRKKALLSLNWCEGWEERRAMMQNVTSCWSGKKSSSGPRQNPRRRMFTMSGRRKRICLAGGSEEERASDAKFLLPLPPPNRNRGPSRKELGGFSAKAHKHPWASWGDEPEEKKKGRKSSISSRSHLDYETQQCLINTTYPDVAPTVKSDLLRILSWV